MNWNPWVRDRLTVPKTFNKIFKVKGKNIMVDPELDVFSYEVKDSWRGKLLEALNRNTNNIFFIPTLYPGNVVNDFNLPHVWVGLKLNKNNRLALLKYDELQNNGRRWIYLKNYEDSEYIKELFRCTGPEHMFNQVFWSAVYPCTTCNGTGLFNKYDINWMVFSGHRNGVSREIVDDFKANCEKTGIPFYYERAWINGKLIRDPLLYGKPCIKKPKNIY